MVIFLTDNEIIHYNGLNCKVYNLEKGIEAIQTELHSCLSLSPTIPLCLMIDRNHHDIREEQLPRLMFWDLLLLLRHKKEEWGSQGEFYGYQFFQQDGKLFLQWASITHKDWLVPWLSWIQSLTNPLEGVFFVSLEAGRFLKKHFPDSDSYQMLIYRIGSHKAHYVIFKGKRLLLLRSFIGEEDFRTSLHFLSRFYPDIHEKLQVLNLISDTSLSVPYVTTWPDSHAFLDFLMSHKKGTLSLNLNFSAHNRWIRIGVGSVLLCLLVLFGLVVFQFFEYTQEVNVISSEIDRLKNQIQLRGNTLKNKNIPLLRHALEHYNQVNTYCHSPYKTLEKLALVLRKHRLRLESISWRDEQSVEIEIYFSMQNETGTPLSNQFGVLLSSLRGVFPHADVQIIEAPFKSGSHETFEYPIVFSPPMARLRIVGL